MTTRAILFSLVATMGCGTASAPDPGLEGLALDKVAPSTIIPGSRVVLKGASFVEEFWGDATLRLSGGGVDKTFVPKFVDFNTMQFEVTGEDIDELGGDVEFTGTATLEIVAVRSDNETYSSKPLDVSLSFRETLPPTVKTIESTGVIFVNEMLQVDGQDLLLGGNEGTSYAKLTGCFRADGSAECKPIHDVEVPLIPTDPLERDQAEFAFAPKVAGIHPGAFTGKVEIVNKQMSSTQTSAAPVDVAYDMVTSQVFDLCVGDPCVPAVSASLGQYVFVKGGGFVGGEDGASTELDLVGTFQKTGADPVQVRLNLIPQFVDGTLVRYVLDVADDLGSKLDLRAETGRFVGTVTPVIAYASEEVRGASKQITIDVAPPKQVVFLDFRPSYVEGLRDFGMRGVDSRLRQRIIEFCKEAYRGVNIEFRMTAPTDYAAWAHVEITGVDPQEMGLFGYDNSPGKDNGNMRLADRMGGHNAQTQQDGYPGYGGVFLRSLMGFSKHPGTFTKSVPGADPVFDKIFDPLRADLGGEPVRAADLGNLAALTDGSSCPASERGGRISCAIWVLGNLIGGTLSHEIGHSLGLANPFSEGFHNAGDEPNRIMDSGGDRPFLERAVMAGQGPGVFCDDEYQYLRMILPSAEPPHDVKRPPCY